ncbi:MAG: GtrA family protein [Roseiarcus sp.]|jgi:putative flippase GtrA
MSRSGTERAAANLALARQIASFLAIGGFGFCVDATLTIVLAHGLGVAPLLARLPAFAAATLVNFALNRAFTFRSADADWRGALARYVLVCLGGLAVNYSVYAACVEIAAALDRPLSSTVLTLCIACGSLAAALVTFAGFRAFAFRAPKAAAAGGPAATGAAAARSAGAA